MSDTIMPRGAGDLSWEAIGAKGSALDTDDAAAAKEHAILMGGEVGRRVMSRLRANAYDKVVVQVLALLVGDSMVDESTLRAMRRSIVGSDGIQDVIQAAKDSGVTAEELLTAVARIYGRDAADAVASHFGRPAPTATTTRMYQVLGSRPARTVEAGSSEFDQLMGVQRYTLEWDETIRDYVLMAPSPSPAAPSAPRPAGTGAPRSGAPAAPATGPTGTAGMPATTGAPASSGTGRRWLPSTSR